MWNCSSWPVRAVFLCSLLSSKTSAMMKNITSFLFISLLPSNFIVLSPWLKLITKAEKLTVEYLLVLLIWWLFLFQSFLRFSYSLRSSIRKQTPNSILWCGIRACCQISTTFWSGQSCCFGNSPRVLRSGTPTGSLGFRHLLTRSHHYGLGIGFSRSPGP